MGNLSNQIFDDFSSICEAVGFSLVVSLTFRAVLHLYSLPGLSSSVDRFDDPDISLTFFAWNLHGLTVYDRLAVVVHLFGLLPGNIVGKINFA